MSRAHHRVARAGVVDAGSTVALNFVGLLLGFAVSVLVARSLGPSGKGLFSLAAILVAQVVLVSSLGLDVAAVHFVGKRRIEPAHALRMMLPVGRLAAAVGTVVAFLVLFGILRPTMDAGERVAVATLLLMIPLSLSATLRMGVIRATGRLIEGAAILTFYRVAALMGAGVAWALDLGLPGFVLSTAAAVAAQFAISTALTRRAFGVSAGARRRDVGDEPTTKDLVSYGVKGHVGTVLQAVNYRLDTFLVAGLVGVPALGLYTVAVGLAELLFLAPNVLGVLLMQRAASLEERRSVELTARVTRLCLSGVVILGGVLVACSSPMIAFVYGEQFVDAVPAVVGLMPGVAALTVWKNLSNDLAGRGHPFQKTVSAGIAGVVTVGLDLVLIPSIGIAGAAYASTVAYACAAAVSVTLFRRITGASVRSLLVVRRDDLAALAAAVRRQWGGSRRRGGGSPGAVVEPTPAVPPEAPL